MGAEFAIWALDKPEKITLTIQSTKCFEKFQKMLLLLTSGLTICCTGWLKSATIKTFYFSSCCFAVGLSSVQFNHNLSLKINDIRFAVYHSFSTRIFFSSVGGKGFSLYMDGALNLVLSTNLVPVDCAQSLFILSSLFFSLSSLCAFSTPSVWSPAQLASTTPACLLV